MYEEIEAQPYAIVNFGIAEVTERSDEVIDLPAASVGTIDSDKLWEARVNILTRASATDSRSIRFLPILASLVKITHPHAPISGIQSISRAFLLK